MCDHTPHKKDHHILCGHEASIQLRLDVKVLCRQEQLEKLGNVSNGERERQLELAEASSIAVIGRLASAPLPWVQWLSGKSA